LPGLDANRVDEGRGSKLVGEALAVELSADGGQSEPGSLSGGFHSSPATHPNAVVKSKLR